MTRYDEGPSKYKGSAARACACYHAALNYSLVAVVLKASTSTRSIDTHDMCGTICVHEMSAYCETENGEVRGADPRLTRGLRARVRTARGGSQVTTHVTSRCPLEQLPT